LLETQRKFAKAEKHLDPLRLLKIVDKSHGVGTGLEAVELRDNLDKLVRDSKQESIEFDCIHQSLQAACQRRRGVSDLRPAVITCEMVPALCTLCLIIEQKSATSMTCSILPLLVLPLLRLFKLQGTTYSVAGLPSVLR